MFKGYEKKKNWEVGAGIGVHDSERSKHCDVYFPVSIQRNFSHDKALECVVQIDDSGNVSGGEMLYKKRF